jgi:hypothetical protein
MVSAILTLLFIIGFAGKQYYKGGLLKGFVVLLSVIIGIMVSMNFFEYLAGFATGYIGAKAYPLVLGLVFAFTAVLIVELARKLLKYEVSFDPLVEHVGGIVLGAFAGYLVAGMVLILIGLAPYRITWLYSRFDGQVNFPPEPTKAPLNPDGFVAGMAGFLSAGSMQGTNSFGLVHADYPDQIALDRIKLENVTPFAQAGVIDLDKINIRPALEGLKKAGGEHEELAPVSGQTLMLLRFKFNSTLAEIDSDSGGQGKLVLAQLRLITVSQHARTGPEELQGTGNVVYPAGYIDEAGLFVAGPLTAEIEPPAEKVFEVAYYVPADQVPVLIQFKDNVVEQVRLARPVATPAEGTSEAPAPATDAN